MEKSPLGRLSAEVRNQIYEHLFADQAVVLDKIESGCGAIVHVCRVLRNEARLLLFTTAKLQLKNITLWADQDSGKTPNDTLRPAFGDDATRIILSRRIAVLYVDNVPLCWYRPDCPGCSSPGAEQNRMERDEHGDPRPALIVEDEHGVQWVHHAETLFCFPPNPLLELSQQY